MTLADLNKRKYPTTSIIDSNLLVLFQRLTKVEKAWLEADPTHEPFDVTSGLRSDAQQRDMIKAGKSKAIHSKHLLGAAADIYDPDGRLKAWLKDHPAVLEDAMLWCEASESTPNWWHAQIIPPGSGNRWFLP